jgi:hypothetical protein
VKQSAASEPGATGLANDEIPGRQPVATAQGLRLDAPRVNPSENVATPVADGAPADPDHRWAIAAPGGKLKKTP